MNFEAGSSAGALGGTGTSGSHSLVFASYQAFPPFLPFSPFLPLLLPSSEPSVSLCTLARHTAPMKPSSTSFSQN